MRPILRQPRRSASERRRSARSWNRITLGILLVLASTGIIAPTADGATGFAFQEAPQAGLPSTTDVPAPLSPSQFAHRLSSEVYGYLPYWEINSTTDAYLRYDLLSDIAVFSVGLTADGLIDQTATGYARVTGPTTATVIQHAHASGVRVDLTLTSFGQAKNAAFFASDSAQATAIGVISALVLAKGFDGVAVDVELLANSDFAAYGAFVGRLRAALRAANPAARVSVATNGSISGGGMAAQALANGADRVFIMGYSYRTSGTSPAGSIDPIARTDGGKSLTTTLDLYAGMQIPANRILLGLPYYGRSWNTTSGDLHATTTSSAGLFIPGTDLAAIPAGTSIQTDPVEGSRWFAIQDPITKSWTETYFDDPATLGARYVLAAGRGLAGIGIWALGYDEGRTDYWNAIVGAFGTVRRAGPDRFSTAAAISADAFEPGIPVAYVATGASFPDALAAAAAAGLQKAPVLLVTATTIPVATLAELKRLKPARIVVAGGTAVVSNTVLTQLAGLSAGGARRVAGPDRYGTAAAISAATFPTTAPVAYITAGGGFADAVSAAAAAARDGGPILLTRTDVLPEATRAELARLAPARIVIIGGTASVSTSVATAVSAAVPGAVVSRIAGKDRYETSAAIAATFAPNVPVIYAASGLSFADALAAAAAAGAQGAPVLLTAPTILPAAIRTQIVRLEPTRAVVAGGTAVVSDSVLVAVRSAVAAP